MNKQLKQITKTKACISTFNFIDMMQMCGFNKEDFMAEAGMTEEGIYAWAQECIEYMDLLISEDPEEEGGLEEHTVEFVEAREFTYQDIIELECSSDTHIGIRIGNELVEYGYKFLKFASQEETKLYLHTYAGHKILLQQDEMKAIVADYEANWD